MLFYIFSPVWLEQNSDILVHLSFYNVVLVSEWRFKDIAQSFCIV